MWVWRIFSCLEDSRKEPYGGLMMPVKDVCDCVRETGSPNGAAQGDFLCSRCGLLKVVAKDVNFFDLLGISEGFDLDTQELQTQYLRSQLYVHPDRWVAKSPSAQSRASDISALLNQAYKTMKCPFLRASYMLSLKATLDNQGKAQVGSKNPPSGTDLVALFELRERLESQVGTSWSDQEEKNLTQKRDLLVPELKSAFDREDFEQVAALVDEERFLARTLDILRK